MCFNVTDKRVYRATKNIVCYKGLDGPKSRPSSPVYTQRYSIGKRYDILFNPDFLSPRQKKVTSSIINEGFHSYTTIENGEAGYGAYLFKAIIPKGARYIINKREGQIVSEAIIIKKFIRDI